MAQSIQQAVSDLTAKVEQTLGVAGDDSKQQGQGGAKTEVSGEPIYVDEKTGSDSPSTTSTSTSPEGTPSNPFTTILQAMLTSFPSSTSPIDRPIMVRPPKAAVEAGSGTSTPVAAASDTSAEWALISGAALKKNKKLFDAHWKKVKKAEENKEALGKAEREREEREVKRREEASKIVIKEDESLGKAGKVKIGHLAEHRDQRVRVFGWVHRLRQQAQMTFITLRDGTGYLQLVLAGDLHKTLDALDLVTECTIEVTGTLKAVPEGKTAPGGHELSADWWKVIGKAPSGIDSYASMFNEHADASIRQRLRHLDLRAETPAAIMRVRAALLDAFRKFYKKETVLEVTPPCIVQTSVEGGSTLFKFDYYGSEAYLTQSSQLFLETCLPSLGDVFCVQESFRAENSHTRRHLAEYTHVEAELGFITFDDLLTHIESMICDSVDAVLADPIAGPLVRELNPEFVAPVRPFLRMDYKKAIEWLNEHDILFQDDDPTLAPRPHKDGDDIAEAAERKMTDILNVPMFITGFPREMKAFYMKRFEHDERYTESCDLLMPGVGEIVGGSMRMTDLGQLLEGYKEHGIDPTPYYWYNDQRTYGTMEHGGYGLGTERILAWLLKRHTVREVSLYPRWPGHAQP